MAGLLIERSGMFEFYAHGVGSITLSGSFTETFFDLHVTSVAFAGRTKAVTGQVCGLKVFDIFRRCLPDNRLVFHSAFHMSRSSSIIDGF
jgi:hypothetical protein